MKRNIVVYATFLIIISILLAGCKASPSVLSQENEVKTVNLRVSKNSDLITGISYDFSRFELKENVRASEVFYRNSGKLSYGEDFSYTFDEVPYGNYTITISAYLNGKEKPVYKSSEEITISAESAIEDGSVIQSVSIDEEDIIDDESSSGSDSVNGNGTSEDEDFFTNALTVEFADADGSSVRLGEDGFYTFKR